MKNYFLCGLLFLAMTSCVVEKTIIEKPIVFDAEREQLTLEYMKDRYGLEATTSKISPKMIVLHWTVIPTLKGSYDAFYSAKLPNWRPDLENVSGLNVSSQFLIDQDGTIYQLMPENQMARHVIGLNHCAIGVENVGGGTDLPLSRKQLKSNIWLVKYLKDKYDIDYVIGHYEYTNFEGHELWLEKDAGYRTVKTDPGERFMKKVRKATKKLEFKPVPEN
ncbi:MULTISPECIES: peptidoglycan recognition protein family protein [Cellulophaga]|jgi:N-acetyl-anhydromuramyl-L-alanine amidase AmpD|uniref:peptidoglycan recognition protein family protein n=1 Tax=Cellulophaga TaxID=104264 RepID=UPI00051D6F68|nr:MULTISPECIES: peptidoglycan recognition family protein [Cellulophaga]KGK31591.1 N-acetylmuramoyl-L-alanine amidase [Cellulophaga sp. E6(2014)]MCR1024062.1 peptidoglycan recognition protein family protein [Cellulophaga baltica]